MDKTLEIVMVAVALVVAVVIVTGILQGRANTFGGFADNQTSSSGCSIAADRLANTIDCGVASPSVSTSNPIYSRNKPKCWSSTSAAVSRACQ